MLKSPVATLKYKVISTQQPAYLHNLLSYRRSSRSLRSSIASLSCTFPGRPILDVVLSHLLLSKSGTVYLPPLKSHHHWTPSNVTSIHTIYLSIIFSPMHLDYPAPLIYFFKLWCITKYFTLHYKRFGGWTSPAVSRGRTQ